MEINSDSKQNSFEKLQCLGNMNKKLCRSRSLTDCYKTMVSSGSGCDFDKIFGGIASNPSVSAKEALEGNKSGHHQLPISSDSGLKLTRSTSLSSIPGFEKKGSDLSIYTSIFSPNQSKISINHPDQYRVAAEPSMQMSFDIQNHIMGMAGINVDPSLHVYGEGNEALMHPSVHTDDSWLHQSNLQNYYDDGNLANSSNNMVNITSKLEVDDNNLSNHFQSNINHMNYGTDMYRNHIDSYLTAPHVNPKDGTQYVGIPNYYSDQGVYESFFQNDHGSNSTRNHQIVGDDMNGNFTGMQQDLSGSMIYGKRHDILMFPDLTNHQNRHSCSGKNTHQSGNSRKATQNHRLTMKPVSAETLNVLKQNLLRKRMGKGMNHHDSISAGKVVKPVIVGNHRAGLYQHQIHIGGVNGNFSGDVYEDIQIRKSDRKRKSSSNHSNHSNSMYVAQDTRKRQSNTTSSGKAVKFSSNGNELFTFDNNGATRCSSSEMNARSRKSGKKSVQTNPVPRVNTQHIVKQIQSAFEFPISDDEMGDTQDEFHTDIISNNRFSYHQT